ncbi:MAG: hypothetical protein ACC742_08450 [Thermoanaerobaculales bacterium]
MSVTTTGATAATSAAATIANAIKASGVIVKVEPGDFQAIVDRQEAPLVVTAEGGFLSKTHRYLCSYKGLAFYAESGKPLELPGVCELIRAKKIWIPG